MSERVVIAGGSGFLGMSLAKHLASGGHRVTILSRTAPREPGAWSHVAWDGRSLGAWSACLDGCTALVNLAGRTVDCIKTPAHCDEILRSRVEATRVLGMALKTRGAPRVWVQMSTAHIYGDPPSLVCDEDAPLGYGLAPFVGREWEAAFRESVPTATRAVVLRTSFVLGRSAGALARLLILAKLGLAGTIGRGTQGMSWIHERDMNRIFERALFEPSMCGVYIASAPNPVPQREFMRELRRAAGVPFGLPAFEWMVRIGAPLLMRTDPELAIYGRYCVSRRLREEGFAFEFPELRGAMRDLLARA